jgi:DGQHR domain-containing protein
MDAKSPNKKKPRVIGYSCLQVAQNDHRFYLTTIPVSVLFDCCFLAARHEDPHEGFQRRLNKSRAQDIAAYLKRGDGSIPNNVVLSAQLPASEFRYDSKKKQLFFAKVNSGFLVLDGQHRLYGYQLCYEQFAIDHRVPVSIYPGLSRQDEARLFIDINTKQVGVPAALLLDIKQVANTEDAEESVIRTISDRLSADPNSPLYGKLSTDSSKAGKLSRPTFKRALLPIVKTSLFAQLDSDGRYSLVRNFLKGIQQNVTPANHMFRAAFFEAVFDVFEETVKSAIERFQNAKEDSISSILRPLQEVDFAQIQPNRVSFSGAIKKALRQNITISKSLV